MVPVPVPQMNGTPGLVLEKNNSGLTLEIRPGLGKLPINTWLTLSSRLFFPKK
jgi:hypothetical protein